ncbi:MAG: site-specific DNA-methyltransferase [Treponema sp.]|nr:site-specific DNA-methyltransferase [Treponema sp.]
MATGVTKSIWDNLSCVIPIEGYLGNNDYELVYPYKRQFSEIIQTLSKSNYKEIFHNDNMNSIYFGENFDVLCHLYHGLNLGDKINLIYIDPPFSTNSVFQSRNQRNSYKDDLIGSHYIEFMRIRLILLRELLSTDGSIFVHLDNNMLFQIKIIMDEIFGSKNFRGFITRKKCSNKNYTKNTYGNISDYILFYSKTDSYKWHRPTETWSNEKILKEYPFIDELTGRRYKKVPIHAPGSRNGETGKTWKGMLPPPGKHWQYTPEKLTEFDEKGEIYWSSNGNPRRKVFLEEDKGVPVQDIWLNLQDSLNQNIKITGYPTEKNPYLLERIINASSDKDDLILDCFAGSGTTLDVANQLGRKFIGIDNSLEAVTNIIKRFSLGLEEMGDYVNIKNKKQGLFVFSPTTNYNPDNSKSTNFSFFTDEEYVDIATILLEKYLYDRNKTTY